MTSQIVFWDHLDASGWGIVTAMHRSPHRLAPEVVALGVAVDIPPRPTRDGWTVTGWVHPDTLRFEWRQTRDPSYRVPVSEFLAALPASARVQARARRETDPVIDDFLLLLEMASAEGRGVNPHGVAARAGLAYLVSLGLMQQAEADAITDKAND